MKEKIEGSFNHLSSDSRIRLFVIDEDQTRAWVSPDYIQIDYTKKTWSGEIYFGDENEINKYFYLLVAIEHKNSDHWMSHYEEHAKKIRDWHPFKYPLPNEFIECMKIRVHRIK